MMKVFVAATLCLAAAAQDKVDQAAIDRAIDKGIEYLKPKAIKRQDVELVLWTFLHAGVPETDPALQKLLRTCLEDPIWKHEREFTYNIVLLTLCLQKLDAVRYQPVIAQCGQFFVDTQCETGQWAYGESWKPTPEFEAALKKALDKSASAPAKPPKGGKAPTIPTVKIQRGPGAIAEKEGDNSNSQYAALGIRACADAGVLLPEDTLRRAKAWWEKDQKPDGSWGYGENPRDAGYGSMTGGAIGSLSILDSVLKLDPRKNARIAKGFEWVGQNFSVTDNPRGPRAAAKPEHLYYHLYSLERAGDLTGTDKIGTHAWYPEGARELVGTQKADGSWQGASAETDIWGTCFAILFLKRATQPLPHIRTGDERSSPSPKDETPEKGDSPFRKK